MERIVDPTTGQQYLPTRILANNPSIAWLRGIGSAFNWQDKAPSPTSSANNRRVASAAGSGVLHAALLSLTTTPSPPSVSPKSKYGVDAHRSLFFSVSLSGFLVRFVRYGCHRVSTLLNPIPHSPSRPSSLLLRSVVIPPPACLLSCTVVHCQSSNRFAPQHIWYTAKLVINSGL
ncbi:hypothetical protein DTO271D3_39 [Paecilomyces variotii]|nr:hypothetical protein DTO271D3_39 [Paecilomyces variotii]